MPFSKKIIRRGSRIRVLVVDDSVVIRRLVAHALEEIRPWRSSARRPTGPSVWRASRSSIRM